METTNIDSLSKEIVQEAVGDVGQAINGEGKDKYQSASDQYLQILGDDFIRVKNSLQDSIEKLRLIEYEFEKLKKKLADDPDAYVDASIELSEQKADTIALISVLKTEMKQLLGLDEGLLKDLEDE